jgi:hypothetical protein
MKHLFANEVTSGLGCNKKLIYLQYFINLTWLKFFQSLIELTSSTMRPLSVAVAINTSLLMTVRILGTNESDFFSSDENSVLQNSIGNTEATLISLLRSCWTLKRCKTKIVESPKHDYQINAFQNMKKMQNRKHFLQGRISSSNWSTAHPRTKKTGKWNWFF